MTKISIITINYNNAVGLEKTIKSVVNQSSFDFEYIVIDGNSTDTSVDVIKKYSEGITHWKSEPDTGIYNAMNKGIKISKGDFLLFLNSGDYLNKSDIIQNVIPYLDSKLDFYYGNLVFESKENSFIDKYPEKLTFSFFLEKSLPHPSTFIKRTLFEEYSFYNENFSVVSDWEFFICMICKHNASYKYIDLVVSNFNTDGISNDTEGKKIIKNERELSLKNNFPSFIKDYEELTKFKQLFRLKRFNLLLDLENSNVANKINSVILRLLSFVFVKKQKSNK